MCLIASLWGVFLDALNRKNISSKLLEFWPDQAGLSDHVYLPTGCHGHCVWTKWETQSQHCEGQKESDGYLTVLCIEWMEHHFFRGGGLPTICGRREVETGWTSAFCEFYSQSFEVSYCISGRCLVPLIVILVIELLVVWCVGCGRILKLDPWVSKGPSK